MSTTIFQGLRLPPRLSLPPSILCGSFTDLRDIMAKGADFRVRREVH